MPTTDRNLGVVVIEARDAWNHPLPLEQYGSIVIRIEQHGIEGNFSERYSHKCPIKGLTRGAGER